MEDNQRDVFGALSFMTVDDERCGLNWNSFRVQVFRFQTCFANDTLQML